MNINNIYEINSYEYTPFFYKQLSYPKPSRRVANFLCQNHDESCLAVGYERMKSSLKLPNFR